MGSSVPGYSILVGVDFSDSCERALLHAVATAELVQGTLELVHVIEWESPDLGEGPTATSPPGESDAAQAAVQQLIHAAKRQLADLCLSFIGDRVPAVLHVRIGDPAVELVRAAEHGAASLLVLGARGRCWLDSGAVGKTAARLCRSSPIPVLLVAQSAASAEEALLLQSARGQILWDGFPYGTARRLLATGHIPGVPQDAPEELSGP